jgi:hypothetical protein
LELEHYLPPPTPPIECLPGQSNFPTKILPFDYEQELWWRGPEGEIETLILEPGYVISECELLKMTDLRIRHKRLKQELQILGQLRNREVELWRIQEREYRQRLLGLQNPSWWQSNRLLIGVGLGMVTTSLVVWSAAQL